MRMDAETFVFTADCDAILSSCVETTHKNKTNAFIYLNLGSLHNNSSTCSVSRII